MFMPISMRERGMLAEEAARHYLEQQGLRFLAKNYRSHAGEIDLIMQEGDVTVFIEVRSRKNNRYMHPIETIDYNKRSHIINACNNYLQNRNRLDKTVCRFDILTFTGPPGSAQFEWIKNAFEA
jgi:putative endonuclease